MPHSDDSNQELAPVMHFQQALSLSSSSSLSLQGRGWDCGAMIQFGRVHFWVFLTFRFAPWELSSDWICVLEHNVSVFWIFIKLVGLMIITKP